MNFKESHKMIDKALSKLPEVMKHSKKELPVVVFQSKSSEKVRIVEKFEMENITEKLRTNDTELVPDKDKTTSTSSKIVKVTKTFLGAIMPQIIESTSTAASLIWAFFYTVFILMLALQTYKSLEDFFSRPVTVGIIIDSTKPSLEFPAVTICNNNIVRKNFIKRIPRFQELATLTELVYHTLTPDELRDIKKMEKLGWYLCFPETTDWIPSSWMCNGRMDCTDGSDEVLQNCHRFPAQNYSESCLKGFLKCPNESTCAVKCDGIEECTVEPGHDESEVLGCTSSRGETFLKASGDMQKLTSPNFPDHYMNNMAKSYIMEAPEDYVIKVTFNEFDVEGMNVSGKCRSDYMTIQDGISDQEMFFLFNSHAKMCGKMCNIREIISSGDKMKIKFVTDERTTRSGWSLSYVAIQVNSSEDGTLLHRSRYNLNYNTKCGKIKDLILPGIASRLGIFGTDRLSEISDAGQQRTLEEYSHSRFFIGFFF